MVGISESEKSFIVDNESTTGNKMLYKIVANLWFFTLFCGIKIITYEICIEKEHYLLQNVSCLKLHTEVE